MAHKAEVYDAVGKFTGKCELCGGRDSRHRLVDSLRDMYRAGDSVEELQRNFDWLTVEQIKVVVATVKGRRE